MCKDMNKQRRSCPADSILDNIVPKKIYSLKIIFVMESSRKRLTTITALQ